MLSKNTKFYSLILLCADFVALIAAFVLAYVIRVNFDTRHLLVPADTSHFIFATLFIVPVWLVVLAILSLYTAVTYNRRLVEWGKIAVGSFIGVLLIIGWEYVTDSRIFPARLITVYVLVGSFILLVLERELLRFTRGLLFRYGRGTSRVMIIGNSEATRDIAQRLSQTHQSGFLVVAIAGPKHLVPPDLDIVQFSSVEEALRNIDSLRITTIIQTDLYDSSTRNQKILTAAQTRHIGYSFIPGEPEFYAGKNTVDVFLGYPMIGVSQTPLIGWGAIAKRVFDTFISAILIVILSPVFIILIILQLVLNPGPIFYVSRRLSRYSKPVGVIKFRSMKAKYGKKDAVTEFHEMGREDLVAEYKRDFKVKNDPRITRFGHFLRNTSLDELPQLFNVLKGELSLVGPRPVPQNELDAKFTKAGGALLLSVKSGITGLWQVSGRSDLTTEQRVQIELYYVQNWSFWLDIKILFKTIGAVLRGSGAK